jgi:hypothetical protein
MRWLRSRCRSLITRTKRNAVRIVVEGLLVGYLSRSDAARYRPGVLQLMQGTGSVVGLRGPVVGPGGDDGLGLLGVFLDCDPADFGLPSSHVGALRTGFVWQIKDTRVTAGSKMPTHTSRARSLPGPSRSQNDSRSG